MPSIVGESVRGKGDEAWALDRTSVILVVWLSRMDLVVVFGGCISSMESAMDSK